MLNIYQIETEEDRIHVRELFGEYLQWAHLRLKQEYGINFDIESLVDQDMLELEKFLPPQGRLLLAKQDEKVAGLACMKKIKGDIGEIKRMYIRPEFRKRGIGRKLLELLLNEAREIGYPRIRLDSARFMKAAHTLYRSVGFQEIEPYPESEIPEEFQENWIFMEMHL